MNYRKAYDVLVVGAGPSGSAIAIGLAERGYRIAIVERIGFPRPHVGICLSDQTIDFLQYLGLDDELSDTGLWRRNLSAVRWESPQIQLVNQPGFHVDRGHLDQILLNKAQSHGVDIFQPAQILESGSHGRDCQLKIATEADTLELTGHFLVDAAGRRSLKPSGRIKDSPPLLALHSNWELEFQPEFDGLIASGKIAWLWYAQTAHNQATVSVFCDPHHLNDSSKCNLQSNYLHLLEQFPFLDLNKLARQCSVPLGCDASSYHADDPVGERHIRVGDACLSIDPLSSQGVHLAIQTGIQAVAIVHTILSKPRNAQLAREFYALRLAERVGRYRDHTGREYARALDFQHESFWRARAGTTADTQRLKTSDIQSPGRRLTLSPAAKLQLAPVIVGEFVEERKTILHPNLDGMVAYVDGIDITALFELLPDHFYSHEIPAYWQRLVPDEQASKIASWLYSKGIFVEVSTSAAA